MAWLQKRGKIEWGWIAARMAVQFSDEPEIPEQFYVDCQWRRKGNRIPEHWTFNLIYQGCRIYAIHVQPASLHTNSAGKGRPLYGQDIDGIHEHTWSDDGDGYAEPINVPLDRPDVIWRMFLHRANIERGDFFHPDENEPELDL